ncbi:MAG: NADPH:quinone reductase [Frankiales bacterium]|nr:NADPH:quinone reductase [Frankiales bacterium]
MRAAVYRTVGSPDVIEIADVERPEAGPFEILVKVKAASLNPADAAAWSGVFAPPGDGEYFGLGWDVAGEVAEAGPGTPWSVGDPVIALVHGATGVGRAQAEYVLVPSHALASAPEGVDPVTASTIPLGGLTAWQSVELLNIRAGQIVFITGAGGVVGAIAVRLAKLRGATVVASDLASDEEFVLDVAGADAFIPASDDPAAAVLALHPSGVDGVLDTTPLGQRLMRALKDNGTFVTTRPDAVPQQERSVRVHLTQVAADNAALTRLSDLAAAGELPLRVAATYPLDDAASAHAQLVEGSQRGRVVLTIGSP